MSQIDIDKSAERMIKELRKLEPEMELHELGALLVYAGSYLMIVSSPDLKGEFLIPTNLAYQCLEQFHQRKSKSSDQSSNESTLN